MSPLMLSIVIPTWNEENYLPKLLEDINKQTYKGYEIIIADANSTDKTKEIAKRFDCRIVKGGTPSVGRNNGVKMAKYGILLFIDADARINSNFIKDALDEFKDKKLDVAGVKLEAINGTMIDRLFLGFFNKVIVVSQYFYPSATGSGIFCKRRVYNRVNGFDESITLGEDIDFVQRCSKFTKFRILKRVKVKFSMRRFEREGRLKVGFRHFLSAFYRIFFGQIKDNKFKYNLKYKK